MNALVITALVFAGALLLIWLLLAWFHAGGWRTSKRLKMIEQAEPVAGEHVNEADYAGDFPLISPLLVHLGAYTTIQHQLERAGLSWRPGEFLAIWSVATLALMITGLLLSGPLVAVLVIIMAVMSGMVFLKALQSRRLRQFEVQLADALMLMASSLRAGYGILRSIQAIRDEMPPPISTEFARMLDELAIGLDLQQAMSRLLLRVPLPDLEIAVTAILIQTDVGGSLAEVIEIVAETIRERQRIRAEVEVLTAEGRISGIILFVLPIVMGVVLAVLNPSYMAALLTTAIGHLLIVCAIILQIIGGIVIKQMLNIDF